MSLDYNGKHEILDRLAQRVSQLGILVEAIGYYDSASHNKMIEGAFPLLKTAILDFNLSPLDKYVIGLREELDSQRKIYPKIELPENLRDEISRLEELSANSS